MCDNCVDAKEPCADVCARPFHLDPEAKKFNVPQTFCDGCKHHIKE